jgi:hypothetical protein
MSIKKYSDYGSYLAHITKCKIINTTIPELTIVYNELNICCAGIQQNDYLSQNDSVTQNDCCCCTQTSTQTPTQNLYISTEPNYTIVSLQCKNSLIVKPTDIGTSPYFSIFTLQCDSTTINGLEKNITNTSSVGEKQNIYIYSINNNQGVIGGIGRGGFNSGGSYFTYYIFPISGDNLFLIWSETENTWIVQSYGGVFTNTTP